MNISELLADKPWIALIAVAVFFALVFGYSIYKGKKGEIPIDLKNPEEDKRRADVGSTDSRIMPRNNN